MKMRIVVSVLLVMAVVFFLLFIKEVKMSAGHQDQFVSQPITIPNPLFVDSVPQKDEVSQAKNADEGILVEISPKVGFKSDEKGGIK